MSALASLAVRPLLAPVMRGQCGKNGVETGHSIRGLSPKPAAIQRRIKVTIRSIRLGASGRSGFA